MRVKSCAHHHLVRLVYALAVRVTGQELTARVREHLGDKAETLPGFAIAIGLRGTDSAGAARVKRWLKGKGAPYGSDPDYEGTICLLNALEAIDWTKVTGLPQSDAAGTDRLGKKVDRALDAAAPPPPAAPQEATK